MSEAVFAELPIGKRVEFFKVWTEADMEAFAILSGDTSMLHCSDAYAQGKGFKGSLAYGLMSSSLMSMLVGKELVGDNGLELRNSFRYHRPVYVGDEVRILGEIREKHPGTATVTVTMHATVGPDIVLTGEALVQVLAS